jgi:hypothetical protein
MTEPAYRTAYKTNDAPICPECGEDFTGQKYLNVMAHRENHYPDYAKDNFSVEASDRREVLAEIAKRLGN